ncbi:MAG: hypothetical protein ACRDLR_09825, partial [Gaiellaceae bacterium]
STALYDLYRAGTGAAVRLLFTGKAIGTSAESLEILLPIAFLEDGAAPQVAGPGVLTQTIPLTALYDAINPAIQVTYISTDVAL